MRDLEVRLRRLMADENDHIFRTIAEVFAKFCGPFEDRLAELSQRIDGMKGRDGVSVVAAGLKLGGELTLTLSDGTVLTLKRARGEAEPPIDLPNVLEARRWR